MGYLTRYNLKWEIPPSMQAESTCEHEKPLSANFCPVCGLPVGEITPDEAIGNYIESVDDWWGVNRYGKCMGSCKWYEHCEDMCAMSKQFPGVLFILHGEGEESGDLWNEYYLNGKYQETIAKIEYDEFDPDKLMEL